MTRWIDRVKENVRNSLRAFVLGPSVVDATMATYGTGNSETFSPEVYGEYIATSNGVYTCATGRADLLSSLPLKAMKLRNGKKEDVTAGALVQLLTKVNPFWTMNRLIQMTELSLCLWGKAFWFLERGQSGRQVPREIWWGRPDRVTVLPDPVNYIKGFVYDPKNGMRPIAYLPSEVIWFRFPNPLDEYEGLSPLAAARIAADYAGDAWRSNRNLFRNGQQMGGVVVPKANLTMTEAQAKELEALLDARFKGMDKAHRWGVFRFEAEMKELGINPKDAEFVAGIRLSLEEICRAYKWPLDLVGGQRTYENFNAALRAAWTHAVLPEGRFLATEMTEQLAPMFPGEADLIEFDESGVDVLQEAENERWNRSKEQIDRGALLINEWREEEGKEPVPWGDTWWAQATLTPVEELSAASEQPSDDSKENSPVEEDEEERLVHQQHTRMIEFGSRDHERMWRKFERRASRWEKVVAKAIEALMRRQRESILAKLQSDQGQQNPGSLAEKPFSKAEWTKRFRVEMRPMLRDLVQETGEEEFVEMGKLELVFDVKAKEAVRFIEKRAQRFAVEVNETTWNELRNSLAEGIDEGEGILKLMERVEEVMADRIRSSSEVIARTEVAGAMNGGRLIAWKQTGLKVRKTWLAELDDRTRESHVEAHMRYQTNPIGLDEDFEVGTGIGPAPGQLGTPEEDINCRCTMQPVVEEEEE